MSAAGRQRSVYSYYPQSELLEQPLGSGGAQDDPEFDVPPGTGPESEGSPATRAATEDSAAFGAESMSEQAGQADVPTDFEQPWQWTDGDFSAAPRRRAGRLIAGALLALGCGLLIGYSAVDLIGIGGASGGAAGSPRQAGNGRIGLPRVDAHGLRRDSGSAQHRARGGALPAGPGGLVAVRSPSGFAVRQAQGARSDAPAASSLRERLPLGTVSMPEASAAPAAQPAVQPPQLPAASGQDAQAPPVEFGFEH